MLKYLAALALAPSIALAAPVSDPYFGGAPKPVQKLMLSYWSANDDCRGGDIGVYNVRCVERNRLFYKIMAKGWCWNVTDTYEAVATWGRCRVHGHT